MNGKLSLLCITIIIAIVLSERIRSFQPYDFGEHEPLFLEQFDDKTNHKWVSSESRKRLMDGGNLKEIKYHNGWKFSEATVYPGLLNDKGLVLMDEDHYYAISTRLEKPIYWGNNTMVIQYEVKLQEGLDCGGAYIKLFQSSINDPTALYMPDRLDDKTPFTVLFGPDRCGKTDKVHFTIQHLNKKTGTIQNKSLINPPSIRSTKLSTLYTLVIERDGKFRILINRELIRSGSILTDFDPSINPPSEIDDPRDIKPSDWVDDSKIPDPTAVKPIDWDETIPPYIEDSRAKMPEGWLVNEAQFIPDPDYVMPKDGDRMDPPLIYNPKCIIGCGEWTRPLKKNPLYKGIWTPPLIDNPAYKGPWIPRKIPNPEHFIDPDPTNFIASNGIGFEVYTMQGGILIDNIIITNDVEQASNFARATWEAKYDIERTALEQELFNRGISDDPTFSNMGVGDNTDDIEEAPITVKLISTSMLMLKQWNTFLELLKRNPKRALKQYPYIFINTLLITFLLAYLISSFFYYRLISNGFNNLNKEKSTEKLAIGVTEKIQKSAQMDSSEFQSSPPEERSFTHTQIPRPIARARAVK